MLDSFLYSKVCLGAYVHLTQPFLGCVEGALCLDLTHGLSRGLRERDAGIRDVAELDEALDQLWGLACHFMIFIDW